MKHIMNSYQSYNKLPVILKKLIMKYFTLLLISSALMISLNIEAQENLPFFDDFEEVIGDGGVFENWTSENLEGWHYWHIIPWNGNPGQCMRFENTDLDQNDWLVTKPINCEGVNQVKINFDTWFQNTGTQPMLFYTDIYNGDASQSSWTELEYSLGETESAWHSSADIIIDNPGNILYLGFQYQAAANEGIYFLLDNFEVEEYIPIEPHELVGSSEHFEFYTNLPDETDYWLEIKDTLEDQFAKLSSLWNRPGIEDVIDFNDTIKVYYSAREDIDQFSPETPNWKCGFHNISKLEIYLSPLSEPFQVSYYANLQNLAINEFSQLAISKKFLRENSSYFPPYFLEGFGLYESGYRPRRDSILEYLNENPEPDFDFLTDTSGISNTLKRDLIISNIEGQILTPWSYLNVNPGASSYIAGQWSNYLKHFYNSPDNDRIKLLTSTEYFDFYGAVSDSAHHAEATSYFENARSFYVENYNFSPNHRFNVVFCPSDTIGGDLTGWGLLNGGAGCGGDLVIELSPNFNYDEEIYYSKYFGYNGMCAHEFFHVYYNHFMWEIPGGFWAEGTADFNQRHSLGWEIPPHSLWKIEWLFSDYAEQYNVDPDLEHISTNPNNVIDIYFFGDMFFEYLYIHHGGYEKIMEFFNQGMDYSVFNATYNEIDEGYINFLKVHNPNAVNQTYFKNEFKVYPNPLTDASIISFKTKSDGNVTLSVCNLKGQEILTIVDAKLIQGTYKYRIGKSKLTPGIYIVSLSTPLYQSNIKLIVND